MDVNILKIEKFICGEPQTEAQSSLDTMLANENLGVSYADMMRYRVANRAAQECVDTYYVAHSDGIAYLRLWNGWGKHENAIGNFGNFVTVESLRGQGLGHRMLEFWFEDIQSRHDLPLCFLCMGEKRAAKLYIPYGFRTIEKGADYGPLFLPLGDSPTDFADFCASYYQPSSLLLRRPASVEWRHEIDCLLKYCLWTMGIDYTIEGCNLEQALLYHPGMAELLFTENGKCVGWVFKNVIKVHPIYQNVEIIL